MTQISRPFQIALAVLVLFVAVWFLALRGHSSSGSSAEPSTPVAAAPSAASSSPSSSATTSTPAKSAPLHKAHHAAAPSAGSLKHTIDKAQGAVHHSQHRVHGAAAAKSSPKAAATKPKTAATPNGATTHKAASTPSTAAKPKAAKSHATAPVTASASANTQKSVEAQLKQGKVVAVLFWNPNGTVDGVVRHELQAVSRSSHGGVIVHIARADEIGAFGSFTRTVQVYSTPALLLINKQGGTAITTGLMDKFAIEQGVREIKHVAAK